MAVVDREEYNIDNEYVVLGSMISDKDVLASAYSRYKSGDLKTKHFTDNFRHVFRWLIIYYARHRDAPQKTIQKIFEDKRKNLSANSQELIEEYLDVLAEQYLEFEKGDISPDYVKNEVIPNFIREREIEQRLDQAQRQLEQGKFEDAEETLSTYSKIQDEEDNLLDTIIPFTLEDVQVGFGKDTQLKEYFRFNGDLDKLVGPFCNSWLVAVTAIEKAGKSYILQEIAYDSALYQKKRVLVINLELPPPLARNRLYRRISKTAMKKYAGINVVPVLDCENNQLGTCRYRKTLKNKKPLFRTNDEIVNWHSRNRSKNKWKVCNYCRGKTKKTAIKTKRFIPTIWYERQVTRRLTKNAVINSIDDLRLNRLSNLRIKCFPRFSVTFDEAKEYIYRYIDKHKWMPHIIVWDYLDILATEPGTTEGRHDIDRKWKKASQLAGELNCLSLTADQATKATRTQYALDQMSTSESKTKDSHLDVRIAWNQTPEEKKAHVGRIGVLFHRHEDFDIRNEVIVTQNLSIARPIIDNSFLYSRGKKIRVSNQKF